MSHFAFASRLLERPDGAPVTWGGDPVPFGTPPQVLARHALRREARVLRGRLPGRRQSVHRLRPSTPRLDVPSRVRSWLAGGLLVVQDGPPVPDGSELAGIARSASFDLAGVRLVPGSGGSLVLLGRSAGVPAVLRVFPAQQRAQVDRAATVDHALAVTGSALVPRLLCTGGSDLTCWALETRLPGRRPAAAGAAVRAAAAAFLAVLPRAPQGPSVDLTGVRAVTDVLGAGVVARLEAAAAAAVGPWEAERAVAQHGDFWSGNLLVSEGTLTGVVDWDAFHARGVPAADLLHLVATDDRLRAHRGIGAQALLRPWDSPVFLGPAHGYAERLGLELTAERRYATGLAWWVSQVSATLLRQPELAGRVAWVAANVVAVLDAWESDRLSLRPAGG